MWRRKCSGVYLFLILLVHRVSSEAPVWKWVCRNGSCDKVRNEASSSEPALSLDACKMFCNEFGLIWPRPTGDTNLGNFLSKININDIKIHIEKHGKSSALMEAAGERFKQMVALVVPEYVTPKSGKSLDVYLVNENPDVKDFSLDMDESYGLRVQAIKSDRVNATISGNSFFGVRHGLETLSQLIIYDDLRDYVLIVRDVTVADKPMYPYRGVLLDTSRNYVTVDKIKKTIDAMAVVKLNTFHWHITDSHSFPFVSERRPNLAKLGAYSPSKVYTKKMMEDIVEYAHVRGIRVLPELDAPAHVGEGWQDTGLTVCFKAEPWNVYCVEPPCGQFNPAREEVYKYLEDLYTDMAEIFKPDIFHIGGDEVSEKCWNSSEEIKQFMVQNRWNLDKSGFLQLWQHFQNKAEDKILKAVGKKLPLITWSNTMTNPEWIEQYIDKDDYIIQMWTTSVDPQVAGLLEKGYRMIMSNYDGLYLDCGFAGWVNAGNNWCSPYIGWQKVYDNSAAVIAGDHRNQILGGEAALWTEQADTSSIDGRLWPRAAAFAERFWAEPETTWVEAQNRILSVRERLVRMGVEADSLQPEWCYQNEGKCKL